MKETAPSPHEQVGTDEQMGEFATPEQILELVKNEDIDALYTELEKIDRFVTDLPDPSTFRFQYSLRQLKEMAEKVNRGEDHCIQIYLNDGGLSRLFITPYRKKVELASQSTEKVKKRGEMIGIPTGF